MFLFFTPGFLGLGHVLVVFVFSDFYLQSEFRDDPASGILDGWFFLGATGTRRMTSALKELTNIHKSIGSPDRSHPKFDKSRVQYVLPGWVVFYTVHNELMHQLE